MTEYWVSQGNKWCDFCKIYIANNPLSIRTHELGQRHKDNVAKRLATMRKENAAKEKEQKEAARALEQIEAKAKRSYQKDLATFGKMKDSNARASEPVQDVSGTSQSIHKDGSDKVTPAEPKSSTKSTTTGDTHAAKPPTSAPPHGKVVSTPVNPLRSIKGAPSSIAVSKRKREAEKPKASSKEEEAALKAREAARKRVEEREAPLLGLYRSY